ASPLPILVLLIVLLGALAWLWLSWLERRLDIRPPRQRPPQERVAADFVALRRFRANGVILLRDAPWEGAVLDGTTARWPDAMRGWYFVWPGRHQVVTAGGETLNFVLYPEEILIRRYIDGRWLAEHPENEDEYRTLARGGPFGSWKNTMVDYLQLTADVYRRDPAAPPVAILERWCTAAEGGASAAPLLAEAEALGQSLIGRPLLGDALRAITSTLIRRADHLAAQRSFNASLLILDLGLRVLPDDPLLLEAKARVLAQVGLPEEALRAINTALQRDQVLRKEGVVRAQATQARIRASLPD
ncbi:MAG TPA: hypothetical protein VGO93_29915, partial [Candidatus Xenobia bacterium]